MHLFLEIAMSNKIEMHESSKRGFPGVSVSVIVTRGRTLYLRIVGTHPDFHVMTATASEDNGEFVVCAERLRLISTALKFAAEFEREPSRAVDSSGRDFVYLCTLRFPSVPTGEDEAQLYGWLERFFEIYDSYHPGAPESRKELREIYDAIATDDSGDHMYLGDGVWLGGDGSLEDRGR